MNQAQRIRDLALVAALSAAAFGAVTRVTTNGDAGWLDWRARKRIRHRSKGGFAAAARIQGRLGTERVHGPLALAGAAALALQGRHRAAGAVAASSLGAVALSHVFERVMPERFAPPGKRRLRDASYPSGHTLETASLAWVAAYVLARENLLDKRAAAGVALLLPVAAAASRVYLDRHWMSEVIGGAAAGSAYAALVAAAYEGTEGRPG